MSSSSSHLPPAISPLTIIVHNRTSTVLSIANGWPWTEGDAKSTDVRIGPGEVETLSVRRHAIKKRRLYLEVTVPNAAAASVNEDDQKTLRDQSDFSTSTVRLRVLLSSWSKSRRHNRSSTTSWDKAEVIHSQDHGSFSTGYWALQGTPCVLDKGSPNIPPFQLLFLPTRSSDNFLSYLPDSCPLSSLCIPGTHETFARYGWPISQCQEVSSTIRAQLQAGIRFMDFRVTPKGAPGEERLLAFHGATDQRIELGNALSQVYDFLASQRGKDEMVIISIKQEKGDRQLMRRLLFDLYVRPDEDKWFLEPRIPNLGQVRGKIVMLSRFGEGYEDTVGGIHPPIWPDNVRGVWGYTLPLSNQQVKTQDWYNIGSASNIPVKFDLSSQLLDEAGDEPDVFALNFISAATFPRATPPVVAKGFWEGGPKCLAIEGMNRRMVNLIADRLMQQPSQMLHSKTSEVTSSSPSQAVAATPGLQACFAIDFYDYENASSLIPMLIEANFTEEMSRAKDVQHSSASHQNVNSTCCM